MRTTILLCAATSAYAATIQPGATETWWFWQTYSVNAARLCPECSPMPDSLTLNARSFDVGAIGRQVQFDVLSYDGEWHRTATAEFRAGTMQSGGGPIAPIAWASGSVGIDSAELFVASADRFRVDVTNLSSDVLDIARVGGAAVGGNGTDSRWLQTGLLAAPAYESPAPPLGDAPIGTTENPEPGTWLLMTAGSLLLLLNRNRLHRA
jgi:hypothetical protein